MRSPAEPRARRGIERGLRIAGILALAGWIVNAWLPTAVAPVSESTSALAGTLPRWTRDAGIRKVHVRIDTVLDASSAAWLAALRRAGTDVSWSADSLAPVAMETWVSSEPAGGRIVLVAADGGVLRDALGPIDTLRTGGITSVRLVSVQKEIALAGRQSARVAFTEAGGVGSPHPRAVYVAGAANWEAKFVIAALEEAGWTVDARLFVAPGHDVVQGAARGGLDGARHVAAILLDSAAVQALGGVETFVRAGGGVILGGDANRSRRLASLTTWQARNREHAPLGTMAGDTTWRGLSRIPLVARGNAALVLEERGGTAAVIARRHYAGRVAGVGYDATWRWRMAGDDRSVAAHRDWWSRLVASVAARPGHDNRSAVLGDAPVAALHAALGAPTASGTRSATGLPRNAIANLLGLVALSALLGEWLLRRARGAR